MLSQIRDCLALLERRAIKWFVLVGVLILVGALLEAFGVALVFPLLKLISDPAQVASVNFIGKDLAAFAASVGGGWVILIALCGFFVLVLIKNAFLVVTLYWQNKIVFQGEWRFSKRLFSSYLNGPYALTMARNSAEMIRNVNEATSVAFKGVLMGFLNLMAECCIVIAIGAVLLVIEPVAAISAAAILGTGVVLFQKIFRYKFQVWGKQAMGIHKEIYQSIQEGLHSLKTTKVHGREAYFQDAFSKAKAKLFGLALKTNTVNQTPRLWVEILILLAMILVVLVIMLSEGGNPDILAILGLFAVAAFRLMPSINRIILALNNIRGGSAALKEVLADWNQLTPSLIDATTQQDTENLTEIDTIRFDRLSYAYPQSDTPVIKDISFVINRGESIGLVGPSGAGKTTMVDILLGLLEPSSGQVLINGHDLSAVRYAWRERLGYVPQAVYVTDDTLRCNVAFGFADDEIDNDRVWKALRMSQLEDFVLGLPDGLDTRLGEHGVRLSGGQQQRVGIARALYHDPDVVVFDEATSSLDGETELAIIKALDALRGIKTLIIIAHRLSTVRACDRLIFLDDGRMADTGTFEELTARNDTFYNLVELAKL